jgi:hypothetical protein
MTLFDLFKISLVLVSLVAAFGFLILATANRRRERASRHWPTAEGVVIAAATMTAPNPGRNLSKELFWPQVTYAYQVGGQHYTAQRIAWHERPFQSGGEALKFIARYPVEAQVPVYYNPANPALAVLNPDSGKSAVPESIGCIGVALLLSVVLLPSVNWVEINYSLNPLLPTPTALPALPAETLLLEPAALPVGWAIMPTEVAADNDISRRYQIDGLDGSVIQTVRREADWRTARETFHHWQQEKIEPIDFIADLTETPIRADEAVSRCGVGTTTLYCRAVLRYGNYVVDLSFDGIGPADAAPALKLFDQAIAGQLGLVAGL